jgi:uncharacterized membrane protein
MAIAQLTRKAIDQLQTLIAPGKEPGPTTSYLRAFLIGALAGTRSTLPLTLLAWEKDQRHPDTLIPSQLLDTRAARIIMVTSSVGEIIADKTSFIPSRLSAPAFIWRLFIGGLAGAIETYRFRESPILGAVLGSSAAALGTLAGYYGRKALDRYTFIPDPVWGAVEDVIASGLGLLAVRKASSLTE